MTCGADRRDDEELRLLVNAFTNLEGVKPTIQKGNEDEVASRKAQSRMHSIEKVIG